jgi:hypothetical protein
VGTRGLLMLRVLSLDGLVSRRGRLSIWSSVISFERGDLAETGDLLEMGDFAAGLS